MKRLKNKVAVITGGASGIGKACVQRFIQDGARVAIGDIDPTHGQALADTLGDRAMYCPLDVTKEASFVQMLHDVDSQWQQIDILVNNAGVVFPAEPVQMTTTENFDRLIDVNLRGAFHGCKLIYPYLKKTQGCVLNISSMSGVTGQANHAVYSATKGAINALTKSAATDWGPEKIRVNALCPTGVWTDAMSEWCQEQPNASEIKDYLNRIHSLGYCPQPDEIASVAVFLCSDDASFVTGCVMPVSGGSECGYKL